MWETTCGRNGQQESRTVTTLPFSVAFAGIGATAVAFVATGHPLLACVALAVLALLVAGLRT